MAAHFQANLWRFHGQAIAPCIWGLARCGYRPDDQWVAGFLEASMSKLRSLDARSAVMVAQALAAFRYRPAPGGVEFAAFARWWEAFCFAVESRRFKGGQVRRVRVCLGFFGRGTDGGEFARGCLGVGVVLETVTPPTRNQPPTN